MPSPQAAHPRPRSRKAAAVAATLAVAAVLGASLQTAGAQPAEAASVRAAATVKAAKAALPKVNSVKVGGVAAVVHGVNAERKTNQLVLFAAPAKTTSTNEWGIELTISGRKVVAVNDREKGRDGRKTHVPAGSYVLSGHGKSAEFLRRHARKGTSVVFSSAKVGPAAKPAAKPANKPASKPAPKPVVKASSTSSSNRSTAPMGLPTKVQAVYHMMWSNSGSPKLSKTPAGVNVVNLAFLQGSTPTIVGWGSQSQASFIADAKALRARGVRIVASVGGAHGQVNVRNRAAFVKGVMELNKKLPLDGLDWDIEGSTPMPPADIVAISKELKKQRGSKFAITLAPNGSNIDHYRSIAVQLQKAGALDMIGQQFYDAVVSPQAAKMRIQQLVSAGIPQSRIAVGMMVGPQNTYWTVPECINAVKFIKKDYPNIRGGYLWEAGRSGTADWVKRLGPVLKG